MGFSGKVRMALFHFVLVDEFVILPIVDGVNGEQRRVVRDHGGFGTGEFPMHNFVIRFEFARSAGEVLGSFGLLGDAGFIW